MYLQLSGFIYQLFSLSSLFHHTYPFLRITSTKRWDMPSLVRAVVTLTADLLNVSLETLLSLVQS